MLKAVLLWKLDCDEVMQQFDDFIHTFANGELENFSVADDRLHTFLRSRMAANYLRHGQLRRIIKDHIITGSAVALHCCKAHSKINRKMGNSTPCKIVTPKNFNLKLCIRD